jgi:hypothetical protein
MTMPEKSSTAIGLVALVLFGIGLAASSGSFARAAREPLAAPGYGSVTGYLDACSGLPRAPLASPYGFGTVTILSGRIRWLSVGTGQWQESLPRNDVAKERVTPQLPFRFVLRAGRYVLMGNYGHGSNVFPSVPIVIKAGRSVRLNIPNLCR